MSNLIYMDNHATTPIAPEVLEAMLPYLTTHFGNASSTHPFGVTAKDAVEKARHQVADLLGCSTKRLSSPAARQKRTISLSEESPTLVKRRATTSLQALQSITQSLIPVTLWQQKGLKRHIFRWTSYGRVSPDDVEAAITPKTILMSFMYANNEVGTINPITDIAVVAAKHGVLFHSDAVQGIGQLPANMAALGLDLASLTAQ